MIVLFEDNENTLKSKLIRKAYPNNPDFCAEIERRLGTKIISKAVIYRGEGASVGSDGVAYLNVGELLNDVQLVFGTQNNCLKTINLF